MGIAKKFGASLLKKISKTAYDYRLIREVEEISEILRFCSGTFQVERTGGGLYFLAERIIPKKAFDWAEKY